jgi:hypothetical protein
MKQKMLLLYSVILGLFFAISFFNSVLAAGSATVSWTPPTENEGGGTLTDLAGYRVYYDTSSHWTSTCPLDAGSYANVADGDASSYHFNNTLTAGHTYYFTVVAYDNANPANISGCASDGTDTEVNLPVTYSADINPIKDCAVDNLDYTVFHAHYNESGGVADINKDGTVDNLDYAYIHSDYNNSFTPCNQ